LSEKVSKYNKLAEIAMVEVLGSVEDERTFNNFFFHEEQALKPTNNSLELVC